MEQLIRVLNYLDLNAPRHLQAVLPQDGRRIGQQAPLEGAVLLRLSPDLTPLLVPVALACCVHEQSSFREQNCNGIGGPAPGRSTTCCTHRSGSERLRRTAFVPVVYRYGGFRPTLPE